MDVNMRGWKKKTMEETKPLRVNAASNSAFEDEEID